ncbi:TAXI family TRAP transporter solute-binding subunit [Rhodopila sp.]|uniref:TAXI family TRAP transporter solute-binding subunit n=1 Tax=Rhodopila sp. TaxID=2480087 RepID=UPI003D0FC0BB
MRRRFLLSAIPATTLLGRPNLGRAATARPATIGIMGGEIDGTFMRIATDLTSVLNSETLRVVPVVGKGSLQNLGDLLHLPGVDLALVTSDALAYAQTNNLYPKEINKIQYICKLYDNDVHVCAGPAIKLLSDLQGKPVNIDVEGAGTNLTARAVFKTLGIQPDFRVEEPTIAQDRLRRGEIAANVYVAGTPVRLFASQPADTGLHFVAVPSNPELEKTYLPGGTLTHQDYPTLIAPTQSVDTVGVGVALAVLAWPQGTPRYQNLVSFVDAFFSKFPALLKPPHHPKWHDVNLEAAQPGWVRFAPAAMWIAQHSPAAQTATATSTANQLGMQTEFDAFLAQRGVPNLTPAQRQATWQYLKQHRQQTQ